MKLQPPVTVIPRRKFSKILKRGTLQNQRQSRL